MSKPTPKPKEKLKTFVDLPAGRLGQVEETIRAGVYRVRVQTPLDRWLRSGLISVPERNAADQFARDFHLAGCEGRFASSQLRDRVDEQRKWSGDNHRLDARKRLQAAYGALGKRSALVCDHIVGMEKPIGDLGMHYELAKGLLIGGLSRLARHYRME